MTLSQPTPTQPVPAPNASPSAEGVPGPRRHVATSGTVPGKPHLHGLATDPPTPAPPIADIAFVLGDAAGRARAILAGEPATDPDPLVDAVRLLSAEPTEARTARLAESSGLTSGEIRLLRTAHRCGGDAAVRVALYPWQPDPEVLHRASEQITTRGIARRGVLQQDRNRLTDRGAGAQIRLGTDARWYPFTGDRDTWVATTGASPEPSAALSAAITASRARKQ
jgi:hypothetical protein